MDKGGYHLAVSPIKLHHIFPFDEHCLRLELNAEIGSAIIKENANAILEFCEVEVQKQTKRKNYL